METDWTLWDDRFWFHVSSVSTDAGGAELPESASFVMRPLQTDDLQQIRKNSGYKKPRFKTGSLNDKLLGDAPGDVRFTVPVLAIMLPARPDQPNNGEQVEQLLALPTFDTLLSGRRPSASHSGGVEFKHGGIKWTVKWDWMYKEIDTETVRLMGGPLKADDKSANVQ